MSADKKVGRLCEPTNQNLKTMKINFSKWVSVQNAALNWKEVANI